MQKLTPYEPKMENQYDIKFPEQFDSISPFIYGFSRPKWKNGKWNKFKVTLYDPVGPSMSQNIICGLRKIKEIDSFEQKFLIHGLGPCGDIVEEWMILGKISKLKFSNYNPSSRELTKITITIDPHTVILNY